MTTLPIDITQIVADPATQARADTDEETVLRYAASLLDGATFPPVVLFQDEEGALRLADGFHRVAARRYLLARVEAAVGGFVEVGDERVDVAQIEALDLAVVRAVVHQGDARDAFLFGATANDTHGLPASRADRRRAAVAMLTDPEWSSWSDREIARRCGIRSHSTVSRYRAELVSTGQIRQSDERIDANGRMLNVAKIGEKPVGEPEVALAWNTIGQRWEAWCVVCSTMRPVVQRGRGAPVRLAAHFGHSRCAGSNTIVADALPSRPDGRTNEPTVAQYPEEETEPAIKFEAPQQMPTVDSHERDPLDRYYTPPEVAAAVVAEIVAPVMRHRPPVTALEPSVGGGVWARALAATFPEVATHGVDADPDAAGLDDVLVPFAMTLEDFAARHGERAAYDLVIGNPPYLLAEEHVRHALALAAEGAPVVFVLRVGFLGGQDRMRQLYAEHPPKEVWMLGRIAFEGPGTERLTDNACASYDHVAIVWERGWRGSTALRWLDWKALTEARAAT